jgi:dCMP deaminase
MTNFSLRSGIFSRKNPRGLTEGGRLIPSWDETNINLAFEYAKRGTCVRGQNGAVIVTPDNRPLSLGYNGAPRKMMHCLRLGCHIVDGSCIRAVHAEINAIINAAARGVSTEGAHIYSTHRPCLRVCAPAIVNAGIAKVTWMLPYETDGAEQEVIEMFLFCGIDVVQLTEDVE